MARQKLNKKQIGDLIAFKAYRNTTASVPATTFTKIATTVELYDYGNNYDSNSVFTAPYKGLYWFSASSGYSTTVVVRSLTAIYVNGVEVDRSADYSVASLVIRKAQCVTVLPLNAGDTVEAYTWTQTAATFNNDPLVNHFMGHLIQRLD